MAHFSPITVSFFGTRPGVMHFALLSVALFGLSGCNRGPAMYNVSGKVLFTDGSVPQGGVAVVRLQPSTDSTAEIRKGASGAIGPDGTFELFTRMQGDGVYEGNYDVTFVVQKGVMDTTSLIPPKYLDPQSSGYKVTVDHNIDDLEFKIEPLPGAPRGAAPGGA
jgi:hypothetical protein